MYDQTQGSGVVFSLLVTLLHFRAGGGGGEREKSASDLQKYQDKKTYRNPFSMLCVVWSTYLQGSTQS